MDLKEEPLFESKDEEILYWKDLSERYLIEKQLVQRELDEYTEDSRQLEKELETSLEQSEKTNRDLLSERHKLQNEIETLKVKLEQMTRDISSLHTELTEARAEAIRRSAYIRELEQRNDDLERAQRVVAETAAATESTLNTAIERNAMLESEVDEKEQLKIALQRLMDEARDLKHELKVKEHNIVPDNERIIINGNMNIPIDSNRLCVETETQTTNLVNSPIISPIKRDPILSNGMAPSARVSALNLLSDILRKMGILEAKIAACRVGNREMGYHGREATRNRRLTRGQSTPSVQSVQH